MKAIIMAGGEGSRLRPLTCDCPKPMLPLMGKPLMEYAIQLLQRYGIREIGATLGYLPDAIMDYFGDGRDFGAQIQYYIEKTPLGTAGSVKQAQDFLNERFIVLSGDGITDFDLAQALRFHEEKGAAATLILKKSSHPQEYGMVVTDSEGRICSFHEKPGRSDVYSDLINTGIYILEPKVLQQIPDNTPFDFGHDLFPALVRQGAPIYGYTASGYWCDVGDVAAYLRVHIDALEGKIHLSGLKPSVEGAMLEPGCSIDGPVYIAPGAHISAGAHIGAYCTIGKNSFVAPGASLKRSLLFPGARVEPNAQLRGCIAGTNAIIGEAAQLFEESVVGSGSHIGKRAMLPSGVKLWPEKFLPGGEKPDANIVWGARREQRFIAGALRLESPAQATRSAEACMAHMQPRELLLARSTSAVAGAMWHAVAAGVMAQGVHVLDAGVCSLPQLRHVQSLLHSDAAILVEADSLIPLDARGAYLTEREQRSILKLLERQDFSGPFSGITRPMTTVGNNPAMYAADIAAQFEAGSIYAPKIVLCAEGQLLELAVQAFSRAGLLLRLESALENLLPGDDEIGIHLPESGETALICDEQGALGEVHRQLACAWVALEKGERHLILPVHSTRSIDALSTRYNAHTSYIPGETALWMNALAEKSPLQFRLQFDGLYFTLSFLSLLTEKGLSLKQWRQQMPAACRSTRKVQVPSGESGRILHGIAHENLNAELGGGVRLQRKSGWAWLGPDEYEPQLNIIAEAADMEASREICDFYCSQIKRLLSPPRD